MQVFFPYFLVKEAYELTLGSPGLATLNYGTALRQYGGYGRLSLHLSSHPGPRDRAARRTLRGSSRHESRASLCYPADEQHAVEAGGAAEHTEVPTSLEQVLTQAEEDFAAAVAMADFALAVGK